MSAVVCGYRCWAQVGARVADEDRTRSHIFVLLAVVSHTPVKKKLKESNSLTKSPHTERMVDGTQAHQSTRQRPRLLMLLPWRVPVTVMSQVLLPLSVRRHTESMDLS